MYTDLSLGDYGDYVRLFQWKNGGLPYLVTEIFMQHYKNLRCLCILSGEVWTNFLPRNVVEKTLDDGLELIKSDDKFNEYRSEFDEYKTSCSNFFKGIEEKGKITKKSLTEALELMSKLFFYYSKTEFFYTDKAAEYSREDETVRNNLNKFDKIKNGGREYLNKIFLGSDSYIEKMFRILEEQFSVTPAQLRWYSPEELLDLFDGKFAKEDDLAGRRKSFIMRTLGDEVITIWGDKSESMAIEFLQASEESDVLKGMKASGGRVVGKAKVMIYGYEDFDKVTKLVEEMNEGDILVAETTSPELTLACEKASAILTDQGGMLSHAAIISRELGIPCIVGLDYATQKIKDGDELEVNADEEFVKIIKRAE